MLGSQQIQTDIGLSEFGILCHHTHNSHTDYSYHVFQTAMSAIPPLRPLCLVLKIFLQQRELNEVLVSLTCSVRFFQGNNSEGTCFV